MTDREEARTAKDQAAVQLQIVRKLRADEQFVIERLKELLASVARG